MYAQSPNHNTLRKRALGAGALLLLILSFLLPASPAEAHSGTGFCSDQNLITAYYLGSKGTGSNHWHHWEFIGGEPYSHHCPI